MSTQLTIEQGGETASESFIKGKPDRWLYLQKQRLTELLNIQRGEYPLTAAGKQIKDPKMPWMVPHWQKGLFLVNKIMQERGLK